jgi:hypothetical protein
LPTITLLCSWYSEQVGVGHSISTSGASIRYQRPFLVVGQPTCGTQHQGS